MEEAQSVAVIQDASREANLKIFDWALNGFSLKPRDKLTLVIVLHQVITPMGYKSSVDSRYMMGANQRIIEEAVGKKKEEYMKNVELAEIFKLYRSKKVEFNIEVATGSSPKAVALKIALKIKATWVILDRKMKNDEEYFLQKLSCGISRLRRYNRIVHLRGRPNIYRERQDNTHESIPVSIPDSLNEQDLICTGLSYKGNHDDAAGSSAHAFDSNKTEDTNPAQLEKNQMEIISKKLEDYTRIDEQHQKKEQKERMPQKGKSNSNITCGRSNKGTQEHTSKSTKVDEKSEEFICYCGAKNFYLGRTEEYKVCEKSFSFV